MSALAGGVGGGGDDGQPVQHPPFLVASDDTEYRGAGPPVPSRQSLYNLGLSMPKTEDYLPGRSKSVPTPDEVDISHVKAVHPTAFPSAEHARFGASAVRYPDPAQNAPLWPGDGHIRHSGIDSRAYEPLIAEDDQPSSPRSFTGRLKSIKDSAGAMLGRRLVHEDEMNTSLIGSAYKFGADHKPRVIEENPEVCENYGVDISSFTGPMGPQDPATLLQYRQLEASGTLTGGLGTGDQPEETIYSRDLLADSPTDRHKSLGRSSTLLGRKSARVSTASTLRDLAQAEANRRGKVLEVVVEDGGNVAQWEHGPEEDVMHGGDHGAGVDLSSFGGGSDSSGFNPVQNRIPTYELLRAPPLKTAETFYPVANWKPISMRWPYLTYMIVVSIVLSAVQEHLLQRSVAKVAMIPPQGLYTFSSPEDINTFDYFVFRYLPTILAVAYGIQWQFIDYEVKRLEAFHQLSKKGGALAAESINVDYITTFSFIRPFQAIFYRHWAVAVSSVATLLAMSLVPVLQSASIVLAPSKKERLAHPDGVKFILISSTYSRLMSATLALIAALGIVLLWILQTRRSGLVGDVKGIAGIAAMATKSHILMDFKDLDTVTPKAIRDKLKNHRYTLQNSSLAPDMTTALTTNEKGKYDTYRLSQNPHPFMLRLISGIPFLIVMLIFLGLLPSALFTRASIIIDKAPWFLTAFAVGIKIIYQTLEQDLRMMEPFYKLSRRYASPKVLTLDYTSMAFAYMPIRALLNADYLVFSVGFGSVLAEILTVCVTSFAGVTGLDFVSPHGGGQNSASTSLPRRTGDSDSGEETTFSFWTSFSLSCIIIIYLVLTSAAVYKWRGHAFLPRQPSTIASVLAYVHQSKMLYDFVRDDSDVSPYNAAAKATMAAKAAKKLSKAASRSNMKANESSNSVDVVMETYQPANTKASGKLPRREIIEEDNDKMVRRLERAGKKYGLGWFTGRDGETHCGVDEEELRGAYVHRMEEDARLATKPWLGGNWEVY